MKFYNTIHCNRTVVGTSRANGCRAELARTMPSAAEIIHLASLPEMPHFVIVDTPSYISLAA